MLAPAASSRVITVASYRGTYPSMVREPFIIGSPATAMLSLTATRRPASGPSWPVLIWLVTYQAPSSLPAAAGHWYGLSGRAVRLSRWSRSTSS